METAINHGQLLKKLLAASRLARLDASAAFNRSISESKSAMRSCNSPTESSDKSCPI
jgi:hypothetical protein